MSHLTDKQIEMEISRIEEELEAIAEELAETGESYSKEYAQKQEYLNHLKFELAGREASTNSLQG